MKYGSLSSSCFRLLQSEGYSEVKISCERIQLCTNG